MLHKLKQTWLTERRLQSLAQSIFIQADAKSLVVEAFYRPPARAAAASAAERNAALLSDKGMANLGIAISPRALRLDGPSP